LGSVAIELDPPRAPDLLTGALHHAEQSGDHALIGKAGNNLAAAMAAGGDLTGATRVMQEALWSKMRGGATDVDVGRTLMNLAEIALADGDWPSAAGHGAQAAAVLGRADDPRLRASALSVVALARWRAARSDLAAARDVADEAVYLLDLIGEDRAMRLVVRARWGVLRHADGSTEEAAAELAEGAMTYRGGAVAYQIAPVLEAHAELLAERGDELHDLATAVRSGQTDLARAMALASDLIGKER
jgi:hypothetical protein